MKRVDLFLEKVMLKIAIVLPTKYQNEPHRWNDHHLPFARELARLLQVVPQESNISICESVGEAKRCVEDLRYGKVVFITHTDHKAAIALRKKHPEWFVVVLYTSSLPAERFPGIHYIAKHPSDMWVDIRNIIFAS